MTGPVHACTGMDPERFFPDHSQAGDGYRTAVKAAREVCARCPVRAQCLEQVLAIERPSARYGIWGGLTPSQRRRLVREQRSGIETATVSA